MFPIGGDRVKNFIESVFTRMKPVIENRWKLVDWTNTLFIGITFMIALVGVPLYGWHYGVSWFQAGLFLFFFVATGLSITLGYHRLFSHLSFQATGLVRWATLIFGAAAFENSALCWAANHRRHHKFVDQDDDPYNIGKGFFHAHIGWILFQYSPALSFEGVKDLQQDKLVMWQHRRYREIAFATSFGLPALLGLMAEGWSGALGGFLISGLMRMVFVHHMTFFINSLCHTIGRQPYSNKCTARDSAIMALFTFGEGYHNFHHAFQHDYRNGVKPWHFDPTKWCIWLLHKLGLAWQLRRVPDEAIILAEIAEQQRRLAEHLKAKSASVPQQLREMLHSAQERLHHATQEWELRKAAYSRAMEKKLEASRDKIEQIQHDFREANARLRAAIREWQEAYQLAQMQLG